MNNNATKPSFRRLARKLLRYMGYALLGLFALLGLAVLPGLMEALNNIPLQPRCAIGPDCEGSTACARLPLPQQPDAQNFPMAVDYPRVFRQSGFVILQASAEWQEAFRAFYPTRPNEELEPQKAVRYHFDEDDGIDARITSFILEHEWYPFHDGDLQPGKLHYSALRDASGEYLLIHVFE